MGRLPARSESAPSVLSPPRIGSGGAGRPAQRLKIPLLSPGQAQKELFHNEALQLIDFVVAGAVEEPPRDAPPGAPEPGRCYIVGPNPTGAWAGHGGELAGYTQAGWRFVAPVEGMRVQVTSTGTSAAYRNGGWELGVVRGGALLLDGQQVVGPQGDAIADPAGGTTIDAEARGAVAAVLAALRQHGLIAA